MKSFVDLHLHSHCSDGSYPPSEVIRRVAEAGLRAASICDHDMVDGTDEALQAGLEYDVEVLVGVELSVAWESYQDIHLLGYGFDHHHSGLNSALQGFRDFRKNRNIMIVERVNEKLAAEGKTQLLLDAVQARAAGAIGRPHIAMELVEQGHVADSDDAFRRYLVHCNVEKRYFPVNEAINLLHRAGGIAVLAHPPFISPERRVISDLLDAFVELGLDGVEAYNSGGSNDDIEWAITEARRRDLIITGGSDFHGESKGDIRIGSGRGNLKIPYSCVEEIGRAVAKRAGQAG
ncbi:MAG: phosphatase [Desulfuromonas sp.]|nr:MAG: phosphatase [Desulfuromonas sp.]